MTPTPSPPPGPRWWRFVRERRLFCPAGHPIPNSFSVTEAGFIRCRKREGDYHTECGRWVFLLAIRGGALVAAEVQLGEMGPMRDLSSPADMLEYAGIWT